MPPSIVLDIPATEEHEAIQSVFILKQQEPSYGPARYRALLKPPEHPPLSYTLLLVEFSDREVSDYPFIAEMTVACADKGLVRVAKDPIFRLAMKAVLDGHARKAKGFIPVSPNYLSMISSLFVIIARETAGYEDLIGPNNGCDPHTLELYSYAYNRMDEIEDESDGEEDEDMNGPYTGGFDSDGDSDMEIRYGTRARLYRR